MVRRGRRGGPWWRRRRRTPARGRPGGSSGGAAGRSRRPPGRRRSRAANRPRRSRSERRRRSAHASCPEIIGSRAGRRRGSAWAVPSPAAGLEPGGKTRNNSAAIGAQTGDLFRVFRAEPRIATDRFSTGRLCPSRQEIAGPVRLRPMAGGRDQMGPTAGSGMDAGDVRRARARRPGGRSRRQAPGLAARPAFLVVVHRADGGEAARLVGTPAARDLPLFVASGRCGSHQPRRTGRLPARRDSRRWELVDGVRVTSSAETLLACARDLGLLDVVVLGDAALHAGDVSRAELVRRLPTAATGCAAAQTGDPADGRPGRVDLRRAAADPPPGRVRSRSSPSTSYSMRQATPSPGPTSGSSARIGCPSTTDRIIFRDANSAAISGESDGSPTPASNAAATPRRTSSSGRCRSCATQIEPSGDPMSPRGSRPGTTCCANRSSPGPADIG